MGIPEEHCPLVDIYSTSPKAPIQHGGVFKSD